MPVRTKSMLSQECKTSSFHCPNPFSFPMRETNLVFVKPNHKGLEVFSKFRSGIQKRTYRKLGQQVVTNTLLSCKPD